MRVRSSWTSCLRQAELVEVRPHGLGRDAGVTEIGDGRHRVTLRELAPVRPEHEAVVHVLRRLRAERLGQLPVQLLVGTMVGAAHDVRDLVLDVVDHGGEMVGRGPVRPQQRDPAEPVAAEPLHRGAVLILALALPHRPFVPGDAQPFEVADDLTLAVLDGARWIGVVDPQQEPVAERAVGRGGQRVADVKRARGARCEANAAHDASITREGSPPRPGPTARVRAAPRPRRRRPSDAVRTH